MHYDFNKDLEDGQQAELEVIQRLKERLAIADEDIERSSSKGYDIKILPQGWTFEVKNDLQAWRTGNVAIEFECRGKCSGLAATTALYWVYKFDGLFFAFRTETLKRKLFEEKQYARMVVGGDARSNTKMYLVKVAMFKTWGKEI